MQTSTFKKQNALKGRQGQATIEAVLIIVLLLGVSFFIQREFRNQELLATLVSGPWSRAQNLITNGGWKSLDSQHPNLHSRHSSPWPQTAKGLGHASRSKSEYQTSKL